MKITIHIFCATLLSLAFISGLHAQDVAFAADAAQTPSNPTPVDIAPNQGDPKLLTNYVEAGGSMAGLTNSFGNFSGGYARASITAGRHVIFGEINGQREFGDGGVYFAAGDTYDFNSDWYASATLGSSAGGFFWPRVRFDGSINRKFLERRQLVANIGYGYYKAKDEHYDQGFSLGSVYYFGKPWIVEEGIRFNVSHPGAVFSPSAFVAVTQGTNKKHYVTLRLGFGEEAYQLVGQTATLNDFTSQTYTVTWRQWVGKNWGFNAVADFYHSPFYVRSGGILGVFKEF